MKLIKPSFEILSQENGIDGMYKMIELAGRTCYKSEDKITEDSSVKFVQMLIDKGHSAMLEHGTIYLDIPDNVWVAVCGDYDDNKYSVVRHIIDEYETNQLKHYITTNYRVLVENDWLDDLKYQCEPTEYHEKRIAVRFICDKGISHELVRHRTMSFAQESTRYCNYSKDKFGNELTFIIPNWLPIHEDTYIEDTKGIINNLDITLNRDVFIFVHSLCASERCYFNLLECGWKPQQARDILPNSLKTELIMTGFVSDWKHFFDLRCAESAHPQMRELAIPLEKEFKVLNLI